MSAEKAQTPGDWPLDLDPQLASEYLRTKGVRIGSKTLANWRSNGGGPSFRKIGHRICYPLDGLAAFVDERISPVVRSTSELPAEFRYQAYGGLAGRKDSGGNALQASALQSPVAASKRVVLRPAARPLQRGRGTGSPRTARTWR